MHCRYVKQKLDRLFEDTSLPPVPQGFSERLMGRDNWQSPAIQSVGKSQMAQVEPTAIYNLDYLSDSPKGSLADAYLRLASATNGRER